MKPIGKYVDLEQLKQKAASIFNIQECRIFYNVNYISEDKRSFEIDQSTYKTLEEVVSIAIQKTQLYSFERFFNEPFHKSWFK